MINDWRLTNQMNYLFGVELIKTDFKKSETNDHEHCEFCFDKFAETDECLKSGYATVDRYHWICDECFSDFKEIFKWSLVDEEKTRIKGS